MRVMVKFVLAIVILASVPLLGAMRPALSAELLVVTRDGCPWCARWRKEIAPAYPKTAEGKSAPFREIDITNGWPDEMADVQQESITPTFILLEDGVEIGRMRGYPGDEFFWFLLNEMLAKLNVKSKGGS
jgi:hypothetical protein